MKKIKRYLLSPLFFSLVMTFIVIIVSPNFFTKYRAEIIETKNFDFDNSYFSFFDLDSDGNSEKVISFNNEGKFSILVQELDRGIIDQWNTHGTNLNFGKHIVVEDYDNDNFSEIYSLYKKRDSVFLYGFEPYDKNNPIFIESAFICELTREYNIPDPRIVDIKVIDINDLPGKELIFTIISGKSRFPRNVFVYNIENKKLLATPDYGSVFTNELKFADLNNNGKLEIFGEHIAAGQVKEELGFEYSDYSAWLMVYNNNLEFLFPPLEFPGITSRLSVEQITINNKKFIACLYNHRGTNKNFPRLMLIDKFGTVFKEFKFSESSKIQRSLKVVYRNKQPRLIVFNEDGEIIEFNQELRPVKSYSLGVRLSRNVKFIDLNLDKKKEFIFTTDDNSLLITTEDFENKNILKTNFKLDSNLQKISGKDESLLWGVNDNANNVLIFKYSINPLLPLKYLIYLAIFMLSFGFINLIRYLHLLQIKRKESIKNDIVNLQLKSYQNQMDPHFTLNVFNTMAFQIKKENPSSYSAFIEFSNLIRNMLMSSNKISRTIGEELSQIKSYLELEKLRLGAKLNYSISVDENIDLKHEIPKMMLQTFIENGIKHGIYNKRGSGTISIRIYKTKSSVIFEIMDDGIGINKAKLLEKKSTGFGLQIMDNYFKLFNEFNLKKIKYQIMDRSEIDINSEGTIVKISIPLHYRYNLFKTSK